MEERYRQQTIKYIQLGSLLAFNFKLTAKPLMEAQNIIKRRLFRLKG